MSHCRTSERHAPLVSMQRGLAMLRRFCLFVAVGLLSFVLAAPEAPAARTTVGRSLNRTLPEMNFDGVALTDAVDFLRDITAANIVVNWRALEGAGVTPETVVNI